MSRRPDVRGDDPRWSVWAKPLGRFLRSPRNVTVITLFFRAKGIDTLHGFNLLAWLDNEQMAHVIDGAWSLTPLGEQWAPPGPKERAAPPRVPRADEPALEIIIDPAKTGKEYGRWRYVGVVRGKSPTRWLVRCSCPRGIEKAVLASNIKQRRSRSCGCWRSEYERTHPVVRNRPRCVTEEQIVEAALRHRAGESYASIAASFRTISGSGLRGLLLRRYALTRTPPPAPRYEAQVSA